MISTSRVVATQRLKYSTNPFLQIRGLALLLKHCTAPEVQRHLPIQVVAMRLVNVLLKSVRNKKPTALSSGFNILRRFAVYAIAFTCLVNLDFRLPALFL
jgi:hypothetical protein